MSVLKLRLNDKHSSWNSEAFVLAFTQTFLRCSTAGLMFPLSLMLMHPGTGSRLPVCKSACSESLSAVSGPT